MFDAHNHLQDQRFDSNRSQIIHEMRVAGVTRCVVNGTSPADWQRVAELAAEHPDLMIPSFGLHPWQNVTDGWFEELKKHVTTTPQACIGECGLDRWMKNHDLELQTQVLIKHLQLATELNLPLSIHCLQAWGALIEILKSNPVPQRGFLLHSYGGSAELVPRLVKLGAYFSFSGYFLHERKATVREAFQKVPSNRILIETDAPDMLPPKQYITHPLSDEINHPANLPSIYKAASDFLDLSLVNKNARVFFFG